MAGLCRISMAKNRGEIFANTKKKYEKEMLTKLKTWKGGLGNKERPSGLKTQQGGPGKN